MRLVYCCYVNQVFKDRKKVLMSTILTNFGRRYLTITVSEKGSFEEINICFVFLKNSTIYPTLENNHHHFFTIK